MSIKRIIPPNVCGKIQGTLKIKVDEVYWSHKLHGQVLVNFKWWGSSELFTFFPTDITRKNVLNDANASEIPPRPGINEDDESANCLLFEVCTSLALFETYLKNCNVLVFEIVNASDDSPLGEVRVSQVNFILTQRPFSSYFPILNERGLHLGDLHVCFHLIMNNDSGKSRKRVKVKSDPRLRVTESSDEWTRVTNRGLELRQAMVESVLNSGEHVHVPEEDIASEAKLVDYLMGKELSKPEEELAIKTLRCISPAESIVEVASAAVNPRTVPKTEARVFKSEVDWVKHVPKTNERRRVHTTFIQDGTSNGLECKLADCLEQHSMNIEDIDRMIPVLAQVSKTDTIAKSKNSVNFSVNSFRLTIQTMHFSVGGLKKINYHPTIKPQDHKIRTANPPGVLFSVEVIIPYLPKGKSRYMKPFEVTSRNFTGEEVIFDGAVVQKTLKGTENPWKKVSNAIGGCQIKALWRHLNQRIPSLLGVGLLPDVIKSEDFENSFLVQVYTPNGLPAAKIEVKVELGIANCFGNELLGGVSKSKKAGSAPENATEPDKFVEKDVISELISTGESPVDTPEVTPHLEAISEETNLDREKTEPSSDAVLEEAATLDNQLVHAIDSLQEKLSKKEDIVDVKNTEKSVPNEIVQDEKNGPKTCCCCCKCCHGSGQSGKQSTRVGSTQIPSSSSSERVPTRNSHRSRKHRKKHFRPATNSEGDGTMSPDFSDKYPAIKRNYEKKTKEKNHCQRKLYETNSGLVDLVDKQFQPPSSRTFHPPPPSSFSRPHLDPSNTEASIIHRYKIDVYSCDAQVFYKAGLLEFYLSYRFPQLNPIYQTVELAQKPTTIELSGEPTFQSHILKLERKLSDALISLSGQGIVFEIWARSFMYDKRHFLLGQAELPIERLLEWEASYDYSEKRRVAGNFFPPDKHFVNLRMRSAPGDFPPGVDGDMISQLGLEVEYEKVGGVKWAARDLFNDEALLGQYPAENFIPESRRTERKSIETWDSGPNVNLDLRRSKGTCSWTVRTVNEPERSVSTRDPDNWRLEYETPRQESEWGARELQEKHPFPAANDSPLSFTPYEGVPSFIERDLSPLRERDFPEGTHFVDFTKETNATTPMNSVTTRRSIEGRTRFLPNDNADSPQVNVATAYVPELDNSLDMGSESKATQTSRELASALHGTQKQEFPELFSARVEIEMALNLSPALNHKESINLIKPTTYVEFQAWLKNDEVTLRTPTIKEECNPEYHSAWNVHLPVHYLYKNDSEFEFRLVYENDPSTILKAYVDLTTLSAGLSSVNGWFSLGSNGHKSAGQVKVSVTPVDDIRKYKEIWINEYRRKSVEMQKCGASMKCDAAQKMKMDDVQRTESLRHKIKELEILTQKMKDKMVNINNWSKSPPDRLMREVDEYSRRLDVEEGPLNVSEESIAELPLDEEIDGQSCFRSVPPQFISSSSSDGQNSPVRDFNFETRTPVTDDSVSIVASARCVSVDSNSASLPGPSLSQCLSELEALPKDNLDAASEAIERIICDLKKQKFESN